jgi:acetyltransferase-like isoleucine patch superfamily enzyme
MSGGERTVAEARGRPVDGLRRRVARSKGLDSAVVEEWSERDLLRFGLRLMGRGLRGMTVKARVRRAPGLVLCGPRVRLYHADRIVAGSRLNLDEGCEIVGLSRRGIVFGERCTVGRFATIRPTNKWVGEVGEGLRLGDNSNIGPYAFIGCSGWVDIGRRVLMGPRVTILSENHRHARTDVPIKEQGVERSFVRIEDDCWLGANSTIVAGVTIGRGAIVAAGSVVTRDVEPFTVVGGSPARFIRRRAQDGPHASPPGPDASPSGSDASPP